MYLGCCRSEVIAHINIRCSKTSETLKGNSFQSDDR
jgi:hypothetical protein